MTLGTFVERRKSHAAWQEAPCAHHHHHGHHDCRAGAAGAPLGDQPPSSTAGRSTGRRGRSAGAAAVRAVALLTRLEIGGGGLGVTTSCVHWAPTGCPQLEKKRGGNRPHGDGGATPGRPRGQHDWRSGTARARCNVVGAKEGGIGGGADLGVGGTVKNPRKLKICAGHAGRRERIRSVPVAR